MRGEILRLIGVTLLTGFGAFAGSTGVVMFFTAIRPERGALPFAIGVMALFLACHFYKGFRGNAGDAQ
ncbi:hypothetical protein [Pontivivens insulae]|uniref:Uncharacterized protein n=1 Tax=Pontivivens insulae TaxID=1639689 RepID=A0A2R8A6I8_9RHOB|nr:hypothetical protein [Pontivivens insulae]RED17960.1 hypothetical protein DFR53_0148 [Pontivivens insulae]SPF27849.1 hypothetical protein POI8812_00144 [Pontivivens insulae]